MQCQEQTNEISFLRQQVQRKKIKNRELWDLEITQIQPYFKQYTLLDSQCFNLKQLFTSDKLKLIKQDEKIYFGEVINKNKHGKGITIYYDGRIFQGICMANKKIGQGVEIYQSGNLYIGEFFQNKKHGKGNFYWFNLQVLDPDLAKHPPINIERYSGDWFCGVPCGKGIHYRHNGDFYQGEFKNGLKHGVGKQIFVNGDQYRGEYVNGYPDGYGEYKWNDKSIYKGDFKQGVRSGVGHWQRSDGEYYKGAYLFDKKAGYGIYRWRNGIIYKGYFWNDVIHGHGTIIQQNKQEQVFYINGFPSQPQKIIRKVRAKSSNNEKSPSYTKTKKKSPFKRKEKDSKLICGVNLQCPKLIKVQNMNNYM